MIKEQLKVFPATVDIDNVHEYGIGPKEFLINALNERYSGRCFLGEYIIKVIDIEQMGPCLINKTNLYGNAYVDLKFKASVMYIAPGDMMPAVEIRLTEPAYYGRYSYNVGSARIAVAVDAIPKRDFKVGWFMPVCINVVSKQPLMDTTNVSGSLICPRYFINSTKIWRIPDDLSTLNSEVIIAKLFGNIKAEIDIRSQFDYTFFENLFYARKTGKHDEDASWLTYTGGPMWKGTKAVKLDGKLVSALEFVNQAIKNQTVNLAGVWTRPIEIHRSSPMFMKLPDSTEGAVLTSANVMMAEILTEIFEVLTLIRHMSMFYKKEIIDSQKALWLIMEDMKI
jgi:hypothetical protein